MATQIVCPQTGYNAYLKAMYIVNATTRAETLIAMIKLVAKNKLIERIRLPAYLRSFSYQNLVTQRKFVSCHKTIFFAVQILQNLRTESVKSGIRSGI